MFGYAIIRKQSLKPPPYEVLSCVPDLTAFEAQPVAFDFETHGLDPAPGRVRSVALANDAGCVAIDLEALTSQEYSYLLDWLVQQRLIAHNFVFDGAWLQCLTGKVPGLEMCTLVMFKLLATEGWRSQRWGLKVAMTDVLGWPASNEENLHNWLSCNKLKVADMAKAPWEILGPYNSLDAAATWQLYKYFKKICENNGWIRSVFEFHRTQFGNLITLLIEQQLLGMEVDMPKLDSLDAALCDDIETKRQEFLTHPLVAPQIDTYQQFVVAALEEKVANIPHKSEKTGKVFVRWEKAQAKVEAAKLRQDFNVDSIKDMTWLLIDKLGYTTPIVTEGGAPSVGAKSFVHFGDLGVLLKDYRELRDRRKFLVSLREVQELGRLYPLVKVHGTVTGRLSGGRDD